VKNIQMKSQMFDRNPTMVLYLSSF